MIFYRISSFDLETIRLQNALRRRLNQAKSIQLKATEEEERLNDHNDAAQKLETEVENIDIKRS